MTVLHDYGGAILLISHDRALLDGLCTRTIAFANGRAEEYAGNFSYFETASVERRAIQRKQYEAQLIDLDQDGVPDRLEDEGVLLQSIAMIEQLLIVGDEQDLLRESDQGREEAPFTILDLSIPLLPGAVDLEELLDQSLEPGVEPATFEAGCGEQSAERVESFFCLLEISDILSWADGQSVRVARVFE